MDVSQILYLEIGTGLGSKKYSILNTAFQSYKSGISRV